ncbi:MAG: hypothetical protein IJ400_06985 [Clostridia bacterium]|nr:hypothetical protein [Clostridia bacterium]
MKDTKGTTEAKELNFAEQLREETSKAKKSPEVIEVEKEVRDLYNKILLEELVKSVYEKIKWTIKNDVSTGNYKTKKNGAKVVKSKCQVSNKIYTELPESLLEKIRNVRKTCHRFEIDSFNFTDTRPMEVSVYPNFKRNRNPLDLIFGYRYIAYFSKENYKFWEALENLLNKDKIIIDSIHYCYGNFEESCEIHFYNGYKKDSQSCSYDGEKDDKFLRSCAFGLTICVSMEF